MVQIFINSTNNDCQSILDNITMNLIGNKAKCSWIMNTINHITLIIDLSSISTINVNDSIIIKPKTIHFICLSSSNEVLEEYGNIITVDSISIPSSINIPNIIISSLSSVIGVCDDLLLDARSTTNLGGRDNAIFKWKISIQGNGGDINEYIGDYIVIQNDLLQKEVSYDIELMVTSWYKSSSSTVYSVYVSNLAAPIVSLHGISEYSSTNLNLVGLLTVSAAIRFDDGCLNEEHNNLQYDITWNVEQSKINQNDLTEIDTDLFSKLTDFLQTQNNEQISIDIQLLLQSGTMYEFIMNMKCKEKYECNIDTVHQLKFVYGDIQCKINGNDILLDNMDPNDSDFKVKLDGMTFTYDPDNVSSNNHLSWNWDCYDIEGVSCKYLLDSMDSMDSMNSGINNIDLSAMIFEYDSYYSFIIKMNVSDNNNNLYRDICGDSFVLNINTKTKNESDKLNQNKLFILTVSSIENEINIHDRLRLFGHIINYKQIDLIQEGMMKYEWTEINGLLSNADIINYKQSSNNSINLILKKGVLESGKIYEFQLIVKQYMNSTDNMIGYGISTPFTVNILPEPVILSGSFIIEPECNYQYSSITELLSKSYTLSLSGDGDYGPLIYQFGYKYTDDIINYYFDSFVLYESTVSNIYLPIGDFLIFANVIDSRSSKISDTISCSITLETYSICLDFEGDIIEPFLLNSPLIGLSEKYLYIFQQSANYLQYLYEYKGINDNDECIENSLRSILQILDEYILSNELCYSLHPILLSQTIILWMDLVQTQQDLIELFYVDNNEIFNMLQSILMEILDPCSYIINIISSVEDLSVSQDSIISKIPKIYFEEQDITNYLSPIIRNTDYHQILYSITSSIIDLFKYIPTKQSLDLYNLLSSSLYISELIRISLSIPGESAFTIFDEFSIYSLRTKGENVNVSITNISVFIPADITLVAMTDDDDINLLNAIDILMVGMNISSSNNVSTKIIESNTNNDDTDCDNLEGELSENAISISLLGNNTNRHHLPSNINFTFLCDLNNINKECDESVECVWYNETNDIWQNDGCDTIINTDDKSVECSCCHLTTFATIHNIHSSQECDNNNNFVTEWLESDEWDYINISVGIIFLFIFLYSIKEIYPFCKMQTKLKWKKHRSLIAVILIGITAFLYILVCIQSYFTKLALNDGINQQLTIKIYALLLLLPQITLFMLFTLIFYTWFVLAHSFVNNLKEIKKRLRKILAFINVFIWCFFIIYYILIVLKQNDIIFMIAAYIWSAIISISVIFITIYSVFVGNVLYSAAKMSQTQSFADNDWKVVRRLLIINTFITIYFIFQSFTTIYFAIHPQNESIIYSISYIFIDAICLLFIFWMYRGAIIHLIKQEKLEQESKLNGQNGGGFTFKRFKSNTATVGTNFNRSQKTVSQLDVSKEFMRTSSYYTKPVCFTDGGNTLNENNIRIVYDDKVSVTDMETNIHSVTSKRRDGIIHGLEGIEMSKVNRLKFQNVASITECDQKEEEDDDYLVESDDNNNNNIQHQQNDSLINNDFISNKTVLETISLSKINDTV